MIQGIHKRALKRLTIGWLLLSIIVGGLVYYLEMEKVDDFVLDLAIQESRTFTAANLEHFNRGGDSAAILKAEGKALLRRHFAIIELYDRRKRPILEAVRPGMQAIEEELTRRKHRFPLSNATYYQKFYLGDKLYLQVLVPLHDETKQLAGYFEGVYHVDEATRRSVRNDVARTLIMVIAAMLVTALALYPLIIFLNRELIKFSANLLKTNIELMEVLGSAVAKRDSDTNIHNYRVTIYAIRLAEALGSSSAQIRELTAGAFLHDVGKIGIRDAILLKPGKLDDEEFRVMRTHVTLGVDIIAKSALLKGAREVVEFHHEKYDGSGYMRGLKGEEIPFNARVFAIVDVFDALTSKRPYKDAYRYDEAMAILHAGRGSHFDPLLLDAFTRIAKDLYATLGALNEQEIEALLYRLVHQHFFNGSYLAARFARSAASAAPA